MEKEQVVKLMTDFINEMNRKRGYEGGMPVSEIEFHIEQATPELNHVNGLVYDHLLENGIIR